MVPVVSSITDQWNAVVMTYGPSILGAIVVLIIGWIVGRLLGKVVRIILDKISEQHFIELVADQTSFAGSVKKAGITVGYIGDIFVRIFVYLIAILAAVNILNMEYMSQLMTTIVEYIPHIVAFIVILLVGFILADYFIDFLSRYYASQDVHLITPVLFLIRVFLYFVIPILALSQLILAPPTFNPFAPPTEGGIGLALGPAIAIIAVLGLKNRSKAIREKVT